MTKKNLLFTTEDDKRSFLEKLTVAYAPIDDLVMRSARDIKAAEDKRAPEGQKEQANEEKAHNIFAVRHLGSV